MRWIAGIDGGGSKTAVLLRTVDGKETRTCRVGSIDPAEYGVEGYAVGLLAALTQLGVTAERVAAVCIGIPCFGEYPELDAAVSARTNPPVPSRMPPKYRVTTQRTFSMPSRSNTFSIGCPAVPCGSPSSL